MPRRESRRPGPKSRTQSTIYKKNIFNESNSSDSDHSPASATVFGSLIRSKFHTPDVDDNVTDYGLEFTTNHIQNHSPRRCSTMRSPPTTSRRAQQSGDTNRAKKTQASTKKSQERNNQEDTNATTENTSQPSSRARGGRRKSSRPIARETRLNNEIIRLQEHRSNLIPKLPFSRLLREILHEASTEVTCITRAAVEALQITTELYVTQKLEDAYLLALHRDRVTLTVADLRLLTFLKP